MSPLLRRLLVVALLTIPMLTLPSAAGADEAPVEFAPLHALSFEDAPVRLTPVRTYAESAAPGDTRRLRVSFHLENTGRRPIARMDYDVMVFAAEGWPRGIFSYSEPVHRFHSGERRFVMIGTDQWKIHPTDRLVVVPIEVTFLGGRTWRPELDLNELLQGYANPAGPLTLDSLVAPTEEGPGSGLSCETKCLNQEERCRATCFCGVQSQSCTCDDSGFWSSSCSCHGPCPI